MSAGLFSREQLIQLGAVAPEIPPAPTGQVFNDSLITTDVRVSKTFDVADGNVQIEPAVEIFNLFNVANYGLLGGTIQGDLTGASGAPNGTVQTNRTNLVGLGSGSFSQGIPRSVQFAIRVRF